MKHRPLFAVFLFSLAFFCCFVSLQAQCDSLKLSGPNEKIVLIGDSPGAPTFLKSFPLTSSKGGTFILELAPVLGPDNIIRFDPDKLEFQPKTIRLRKGQAHTIDLTLSGINSGGLYHTALRLVPTTDTACIALSIPLEIHYYDGKQIEIDGSALLEVKSTSSSWLNFLLPKNITEDTLFVTVQNESGLPLQLERSSLLLTGALNQRAITDNGMPTKTSADGSPVSEQSYSLLPGEADIWSFPLPSGSTLVPDRYNGDLHLKFRHLNESVTLPVKLDIRKAPLWPLLFLILGIVLGRMFRSLDAAQNQIVLFEALSPLKNDLEEIRNTGVRISLLREYRNISRSVEKTKNETELQSILAQISVLDKKINYLTDLDEVEDSINRAGQKITAEIRHVLQQIRKTTLAGDFEKVEQLQKDLREAVNKVGSRSRSVGAPDSPALDIQGAPASLHTDSLHNIHTSIDLLAIDSGITEKQVEEDKTGPIEGFFRQLLQFLSGVDIGIGVKYWFYRPLALSVLFIFILLIGFKEIYIDGGDYFGSGGLLDYAELFTWGLASDLFTRELIGKQLIGLKSNFLGDRSATGSEPSGN